MKRLLLPLILLFSFVLIANADPPKEFPPLQEHTTQDPNDIEETQEESVDETLAPPIQGLFPEKTKSTPQTKVETTAPTGAKQTTQSIQQAPKQKKISIAQTT